MALQMVDRDQRQAARQGHGLAEAQPDHDPADQARPGGGGDAVQAVVADARLGHGAGAMTPSIISTWAAGRDLGHHAADRPRGRRSGCATTEDSTVAAPSGVRRTTEAAVSSQLVSRPRTVQVAAGCRGSASLL